MAGALSIAIINLDVPTSKVTQDMLLDCAQALTLANSEPRYGFCMPEPLGYAVSAMVRVARDRNDLAQGEVPLYLLSHPAARGALGLHDVDANGRPYLHVYPLLEDDMRDLSQTMDHEVKEFIADPFCTTTIVGPDNKCRAREPGDPVETGFWELTLPNGHVLRMTDWSTPAAFTGAPGRKNWLNTVTRVGQILPGGYQILWNGKAWTEEHNGQKRAYRQKLAAEGLGHMQLRGHVQKARTALYEAAEREFNALAGIVV